MITGQRNREDLLHYLEFRNVSKDLLPWLEKIALENNCRVEKREWKSKYNSYVVYDYEPFCSDGFEISVTLSSISKEYIKFIKYLYDSKIEKIELLNNCLAG